jgi:hypothetical protein
MPRVLIAPVEICGNMEMLAEAFRRRGVFCTAANYSTRDGRRYMDDVDLALDQTPSRVMRACKQISFFLFSLTNYDVFHFFYGRTLLPNYMDLPILKRLGKTVVMHFRGEDCLNYAIFDYWRARAKDEPCTRPPVNTPRQARSIRILDKHCHWFFVSTPSLEQALPRSTLVPQVIDLERVKYVGVRDAAAGDGLKIVHLTSSQWKFGTDFVVSSIEDLKRRGRNIDFRILQNVPHDEALKVMADADIGIDTMLHGWYGNISIEFMALGKPVVCFIRNKWKHVRPTMPVYDAHPKDLTRRLEELLADAPLRRVLGEKGRLFVEQYHNADNVVTDLIDLYRQGGTQYGPERAHDEREDAEPALRQDPSPP